MLDDRKGQAPWVDRTRLLHIIALAGDEVDAVRHRATRSGQRIDLTAREFALLVLLVRRTGEVLSRTEIASLVWNIHFGVEIVGIDETSLRRGQDYITVVHDLNAKRLLFATAGCDHHTVLEFAADLKAAGATRPKCSAGAWT